VPERGGGLTLQLASDRIHVGLPTGKSGSRVRLIREFGFRANLPTEGRVTLEPGFPGKAHGSRRII
jgi:hypothetical protein